MERLSGMCELSPERLARMEERVRLQAINSSVNIGSRLRKLYELIENDLLGRLQLSSNNISPYKVRRRRPPLPLTAHLAAPLHTGVTEVLTGMHSGEA